MKYINKNNVYNISKKLLGILLILIGIPGLFLPFLQGIIFITAGLILLGNKTLAKKVKKLWKNIQKKFNR